MNVRVAIVAALALLGVDAARAGGPATTDKEALQGTWRLTSVEINKQVIPLEKLKEGDTVMVGTLAVKGDNYSFRMGKTRLEFTFKVDASARPRAIDLTALDGPQKGQTYRGIYKVEGDTYTICRTVEPGKERPSGFVTRPGSGLMLTVWARESPSASPKPKN
jgi:uncharacterized protein (TIGR03067 family)